MDEQPTLKKDKHGNQFWLLNGQYHRVDGPAIIRHDGAQVWFYHGKIHREDGPAMSYPGGMKKWALNGKEVTEEIVLSQWEKKQLESSMSENKFNSSKIKL